MLFRILIILVGALFGGMMGYMFGAGIIAMFFQTRGGIRTPMSESDIERAGAWPTLGGLIAAAVGAYLAGQSTSEWYDRWIRWP